MINVIIFTFARAVSKEGMLFAFVVRLGSVFGENPTKKSHRVFDKSVSDSGLSKTQVVPACHCERRQRLAYSNHY